MTAVRRPSGTVLGDRPVFFSHIPRTGGTTLISWVTGLLTASQTYPSATPADVLVQKIFPWGLSELTPQQQVDIRFYAPHLPVAAHQLLDVEVALVTVVREPLDQIRSVLDMDTSSAMGLFERFEASPNRWYAANQLGWYLGAELGDVLAVFDQVAKQRDDTIGPALNAAFESVMGERSLVDAACARLETMDAIGLQHDRRGVTEAIAAWLGVDHPRHERRLNAGAGTPLPPDLRGALEQVTASDREIYRHAQALVRSRYGE